MVEVGETVFATCPQCKKGAQRTAYDVGSGPELCCADCDWCWGANGQDLQPLTLGDVTRIDRSADS